MYSNDCLIRLRRELHCIQNIAGTWEMLLFLTTHHKPGRGRGGNLDGLTIASLPTLLKGTEDADLAVPQFCSALQMAVLGEGSPFSLRGDFRTLPQGPGQTGKSAPTPAVCKWGD